MNAPTTIYLDLDYGTEKFENVIPVGDNFDHQELARQHKLVVNRSCPENQEKYGGMGFIQYWTYGWERLHFSEGKKLTIGFKDGKPLFIKPEGFSV